MHPSPSPAIDTYFESSASRAASTHTPEGLNYMIFKVPSNPNHSVILYETCMKPAIARTYNFFQLFNTFNRCEARADKKS